MKQQDTIFMSLVTLELDSESKRELTGRVQDDDFFNEFWEQFLMAVWSKNLSLVVVKWVEFYYRSGGSYTDLVRYYFTKNALNHIRQEFGYSEGTYQKMWPHPKESSTKVEDNVAAGILLDNIVEINKDSVEEMQKILRQYYLENLAI
jgi:hypothetical protein